MQPRWVPSPFSPRFEATHGERFGPLCTQVGTQVKNRPSSAFFGQTAVDSATCPLIQGSPTPLHYPLVAARRKQARLVSCSQVSGGLWATRNPDISLPGSILTPSSPRAASGVHMYIVLQYICVHLHTCLRIFMYMNAYMHVYTYMHTVIYTIKHILWPPRPPRVGARGAEGAVFPEDAGAREIFHPPFSAVCVSVRLPQ